MSTRNLNRTMLNIVRGYAGFITKLAKGFAPNRHLRESIRSTVKQRGGSKFTVITTASGPDARAREFGSGLHATQGPRKKITIVPKKGKSFLAFPWNKARDYIPKLPDGRVLLKKVEHPGVKAANNGKGYIAPAQVKANKVIRKRFRGEGAAAIVVDFNSAFKFANVR